MIEELKGLTDEEVQLAYQSPVLITILIAGADGKIERKEEKAAKEMTHFKKYTAPAVLEKFFEKVDEDFESEFRKLLNELPEKTDDRNAAISKQLSGLNVVFPKLDKQFAIEFYHALKQLALRVAEASGGFLNYFSITPEERKWLELDMLNSPENIETEK